MKREACMVRRFPVFMAGIMVLSLAAAVPAEAASVDPIEGMTRKLARGLMDTFTGWVEIPAQIGKGYRRGFMDNENRKLLGAAAGVFEGLAHALGRTVSGISEVATFWLVNPMHNEGVGLPLDADYAWREGEDYDYFYPGFTEATIMPMGRKFKRGFANAFAGFAEVPGQIMKGASEGAMDLGVCKALWFWLSREMSGLRDMLTAPLPGHIDERGMAFDEEWPWDTLVTELN